MYVLYRYETGCVQFKITKHCTEVWSLAMVIMSDAFNLEEAEHVLWDWL